MTFFDRFFQVAFGTALLALAWALVVWCWKRRRAGGDLASSSPKHPLPGPVPWDTWRGPTWA